MTRRRRDPNTWSVVRLPERDLAESVLDLAAPLLDMLGQEPSAEQVRGRLGVAIAFWNASILASEYWGVPYLKPLKELRKQMRGRGASASDAATFELLDQRRREHFRFDPRLVTEWTYDADETGAHRLACTMGLPDGVRAEVPPPNEKRIAIGGLFLDEVRVRVSKNQYVGFPVDEHVATIGVDGTATVRARMPVILKLFADGRLSRVGGDPVDLVVSGRQLRSMVLAEIMAGGDDYRYDVAVLVFRPTAFEGETSHG